MNPHRYLGQKGNGDSILVMSGTREGREICQLLLAQGYRLYESKVTDYEEADMEQSTPGIVRLRGALSQAQLLRLIREKDIRVVIDATHPYSINASRSAIEACKILKIRYIRYEREEIPLPPSPLIHPVRDYEEAAMRSISLGKRIFLTIGSRRLEPFIKAARLSQAYLVVRVLPWARSIQLCQEYGLKAGQIIAMQGPFSKDLNLVLLRDYQIEVMVSKNTGRAGGFEAKLEAALELAIPMVVIERPSLPYPQVVREYDELLRQLERGERAID